MSYSSTLAKHTTSIFTVKRGIKCTLHTYTPISHVRGIVVLYHGLNSHGTFPTIRYPALLLSSVGYKVYILDLPSHGRCPTVEGKKWPLPIYFESASTVLDDAISIARKVADEARKARQNFYIGGTSMGGALALLVADRHYNGRMIEPLGVDPTGILLLAPMLSLQAMPGGVARNFLAGAVASGTGKWATIPAYYPSGKDSQLLRQILPDDKRRAECDDDAHVHRGNFMRIGTAKSLLDLVDFCHESINDKSRKTSSLICGNMTDDYREDERVKPSDKIYCPILCCISTKDETVSNDGAMALCGVGGILGGKLRNRTLVSYHAVHNIFCDKEEVRAKCEQDILRWFESTHRIPHCDKSA